MAFESDGFLTTAAKTADGEATQLETTATIPTDTSIDVTVFQDESPDVTGAAIVDHSVDSVSDADGLVVINADGDGDDDIFVGSGSNGGVYYYEQGADETDWTAHTVFSDGTFSEIEGMAGADIDGDGRVELAIFDQVGGSVTIAKPDSSDHTGSWSSTELDGDADGAQSGFFDDIDEDGNVDLVYAHEGSGSGDGGVFWQEWNGSDPLTASNWTQHTIHQTEGAWYVCADRRDWSGDGTETDIVFGARDKINSSADTGLYWVEQPTDPTTTWSRTTIDGTDPFGHCYPFDGTGDGESLDIVAENIDIGFSGSGDSGDAIYWYEWDDPGFTKRTLVSDEGFYHVRPINYSESNGDDLITSSRTNGTTEIRSWQSSGSWSEDDDIALDKADDELVVRDWNSDGTVDVTYVNSGSGSNGVGWIEIQPSTSLSADNSQQVSIDDGTNTYPLDQFSAVDGASYWLRIDLETMDTDVSPEFDAATIS